MSYTTNRLHTFFPSVMTVVVMY